MRCAGWTTGSKAPKLASFCKDAPSSGEARKQLKRLMGGKTPEGRVAWPLGEREAPTDVQVRSIERAQQLG
eukprot:14710371-Alexandrium_andersonii.AAC.1